MKLGLKCLLRFDISKHFLRNDKVKAFTMEQLGHPGDKRFGYTEPFPLLNSEATQYIRNLTLNEEFVSKTRYTTSFSPFVLRNCAMHDAFLNEIYNSKEAEQYFSEIVGEDLRWLSNSWDASHMNVQEKSGLDTKIFDWHMDSQPLTLIINVSDMPEKVVGGSTVLRRHDNGREIELKQPAPGYATIFRGSGKALCHFFLGSKKYTIVFQVYFIEEQLQTTNVSFTSRPWSSKMLASWIKRTPCSALNILTMLIYCPNI